jgi:hypothetical protein
MISTPAAIVTAAPASPAPNAVSGPCGPILSLVNRPTVASSPCSVSTGHVLIESGYANVVTTGNGGGNTATYPQAFVRIGTGDRDVEFDVAVPNANRSSLQGISTAGSSDLGIGAQMALGHTRSAAWGVALLVTIPSGSPNFTAGAAQYLAGFNWTYALTPAVGLFGSENVSAAAAPNAGGSPQSFFLFAPSTGASVTLSPQSQAYAEYTAYGHAGPGLGSKSLFDFGYQLQLGPHVVIDVDYGFAPPGPTGQKQHYAGAGLSFMN